MATPSQRVDRGAAGAETASRYRRARSSTERSRRESVTTIRGMTERGSGPAARDGVSRYLTVLGGIRPYDRSLVVRDLVAGVTLAALAIPEVMGYTKIVGTPVITGLYTILAPAVVFALIGSSRHLVVGGDSATAAILYAGIAGTGLAGLQPGTSQWAALASLAALMTGGSCSWPESPNSASWRTSSTAPCWSAS